MIWRSIVMFVLVLAGSLIFGAIAILALAMSGVSPQLTEEVDSYVSIGAPDVSPPPPPSTFGPGGRLVIPSIEVDGPVVVVGRDESGTMGVPDSGWDVGWYDFSTVPGQPGNTVMAGHVDYAGPAVFGRLRELGPGNEIQVHLPDGGGVVSYQVTDVDSYDAGTTPVDAIVGPSSDDILTVITCDGWFNPNIREYDRRLVVRAERVY